MRVSIYARYSSDLQRAASIEDQILVCKQRLAREQWTLTATYTDYGVSGASYLRPGYQKLLADAQDRQFNIVLAEALDRISRDQEHVAAFFKQMTFAGVRIVTLAEGEISELHVGLKGTMNALFLKDLAEKTRRGLRGRIELGRSGGGLCYGYKVSKPQDGEHGGREIDEAETLVIHRIFSEFSTGKSPRRIAAELNREGKRGPGGRPWGDTTIRGHALRRTGILRNELYVGRLVWNRLRYVKDPSTGRRVSRINPSEDWIVRDVPGLRIVDDALWEQVQSRLGAIRNSERVVNARATKFWTRRRPQHLLTGKVICGTCGGLAVPIGKDYIACSSARRQGTCANRASIRRSEVEKWIIEALRHQLMAPDLVGEFVRAFNDQLNQMLHERGQQREALQREREDLARRIDTLLDAFSSGAIRGSSIQTKLDALESRQSEVDKELAGLPDDPVRLHPNLAVVYRQKVSRLQELLGNDVTRAEAVEIIRSLVDHVTLRPTAEGGTEIELVGDIAQMVHLARNGSISGAVPDQFARSVKVVAGVGFEPTTFRL
jgi:DNA invertase Pin-like site-specific DNA recombinase